MKVIRVDNFGRETRSHQLIAEGLTLEAAEAMAEELNNKERHDSDDFYRVVPQDYELYIYDPT